MDLLTYVGPKLILCVLFCWGPFGTECYGLELDQPTFGDLSYRSTNIYRENYNYLGGWIENRFTVRNMVVLAQRFSISPYLKVTGAFSSHTETPWENTLVYGVGLENRCLSELNLFGSNPWTSWLQSLRVYSEYLKLKYTGRKTEPWVPRHDLRIGAELWHEFNVDLTAKNMRPTSIGDYLWGELWCDGSYKETNFFSEEYKSWTGAMVSRFGVRSPKIVEERDIFLMPYIIITTQLSEWSYFWQNRCLLGLGGRLMPFQHAESDWLRRLRIYAEQLWVVRYFKDKPILGTPNQDLRIGVNISHAWWK